MGLTPVGNAILTVISGFALFLLVRFYLEHRKKWKQQDLMAMQILSMVYALSNMNHGIGDEFGPLYHAELDRQMKQRSFVDDVQ